MSVTVVDLADIVHGEFAKNAIRKDFLPSEIVAIKRTLEPVVATPVGGNPEVVVDQETGVLVEGRPRLLADAIAAIAIDPPRRRVMGDAGRWRIKRHFSIARMVEQYASAYLGERATAAAMPPANAPIAAETTSVSDAMRSIV